jgi:hypothetical protein
MQKLDREDRSKSWLFSGPCVLTRNFVLLLTGQTPGTADNINSESGSEHRTVVDRVVLRIGLHGWCWCKIGAQLSSRTAAAGSAHPDQTCNGEQRAMRLRCLPNILSTGAAFERRWVFAGGKLQGMQLCKAVNA